MCNPSTLPVRRVIGSNIMAGNEHADMLVQELERSLIGAADHARHIGDSETALGLAMILEAARRNWAGRAENPVANASSTIIRRRGRKSA